MIAEPKRVQQMRLFTRLHCHELSPILGDGLIGQAAAVAD